MKNRMNKQRKMTRRLAAMLLTLCMVLSLALTVFATYPTHTNYIYDGAGVMSESLVETVKSTNDALYSKVKARISICIVESLGGEAIDSYSRNIFSEWKLGEGVLLVISTGDENYYATQSTKIDNVLTNEKLGTILNEFMEPDFAEGNVARGLQKTVNKLASFLKSELPAADSNKADTQTGNEGEKVTFGGVILSILRIIGWTVLILVVAFVVFFIVALFNDTAAELMNRYIFSHFTKKKTAPSSAYYYDERLYGRGQNQRPNPNRRPQQRPNQNGGQMYDRYRQGGVRYDDEYYGANRNRNRNNAPANRQAPQNKRPQANPEYEYTRAVNINDRNRRGNG